ncbi:MAG: MBL fold metallo-hydrolase [Thermoplasmata archaeon]
MPGPTIQFLGGVREIGGNKILIEDGPDRVLFDFGPSFDHRYEEFYRDYLQPRSTSPVRDLLEFELLPWIPGLYARAALAGIEERYTEPTVHGVFVSHAHFDHAGYLPYLDPEIPVYVGSGTLRILQAIEASTPTKYGPHSWKTFDGGETIRIGHLEVVPMPVDHSVPHAFGFLIRTREGTIVYTGDFRRHGPRAERTQEFLEAAGADRPAALLIEGTRAGPDPRRNFTEEGVREGVDRVLASTRDVALVACYPRDVDRLTTLYRAAVDSGRDLVVPFKTAHLLAALAGDPTLTAPVPGRDPNLKVYRRPKKTYFKWERPYLDASVDAAWIRGHGRDAFLLMDPNQLTELIDLRPPAGTPFVRSMSEPFSEEDLTDRVLRNWVDHFHLGFEQFHASGHCSGPELAAAIGGLDPDSIFPIHTEHPEAFLGTARRVVLPELRTVYPLAEARGSR